MPPIWPDVAATRECQMDWVRTLPAPPVDKYKMNCGRACWKFSCCCRPKLIFLYIFIYTIFLFSSGSNLRWCVKNEQFDVLTVAHFHCWCCNQPTARNVCMRQVQALCSSDLWQTFSNWPKSPTANMAYVWFVACWLTEMLCTIAYTQGEPVQLSSAAEYWPLGSYEINFDSLWLGADLFILYSQAAKSYWYLLDMLYLKRAQLDPWRVVNWIYTHTRTQLQTAFLYSL